MEVFDDYRVEVQINSTWVDLTPDLLVSATPRVSGIGIMSNNPIDRVGGTSRFTFTLNNSESNSVQRLGYYSPGRSDSLNGWRPGLYVRLYFVYDGIYKTVFYGRIDADGIVVTSGEKNRRDVSVTASGWMREAESQSIELIEYATQKRSDEALSLVLDNMPVQPLEQSFQTGVETFLTVFDITSRSTKASGEFGKITASEMGPLYVRGSKSLNSPDGGEVLVFENRTYRNLNQDVVNSIPLHSTETTGFLLMETGDKLLLESGDGILLESAENAVLSGSDFYDFKTTYGKNLYNKARLTTYPRNIDDTPVVLWNLEYPLEIKAGEIKQGLRGSYRDPNGKSSRVSGINMITPVAVTDYTANEQDDGGGADLTSNLDVSATYGTAEVEYILTNTGATTMYVTLLQARGYGVYIYDTASVLHVSEPSIAKYGVHEISIDLPYISDASGLFTFSYNVDRILMETGDYLLMEDGSYIRGDDTAGIFDTIIYDEPTYYIERAQLFANKSKRNMMAFMALDAGSFVKLSDTMTNITTDKSYVINGYDMEMIPGTDGGTYVWWYPTLVSTLRYPTV